MDCFREGYPRTELARLALARWKSSSTHFGHEDFEVGEECIRLAKVEKPNVITLNIGDTSSNF